MMNGDEAPFTPSKEGRNAKVGDFILHFRRSMGYVLRINQFTQMMLVRFPKEQKDSWIISANLGQYVVID